DALSPDSAPRGETDIGEAIRHALETLQPFEGDHNAIILISDGEDLAGNAVAAAQNARERNIPIFAIGIGDPKGATIPLEPGKPMEYRGETVTTRLDNQTLAEIASVSGGSYIPLQTASTGRNSLGSLYRNHLATLSRQDLSEHTERRKVERYQLFLVPAILCFLAIALLSLGRPAATRKETSKI
ncbi:MAG: VWA domain-containing protein, partial [Kiritimatiellaeota bacterium]|nr:VWA domain-containing protein [Kiritimatiellota bacterium]